MKSACDEIIDFDKLDSLVYNLLRIINLDNSIYTIFYGYGFITKEKFIGSYANPKRICIEALLLGVLYYVHKNPAEAEKTELFKVPARRTFKAVRFGDEKSLDFELPIELIENICENVKHQKSIDIKYTPKLRHENKEITSIPDKGNVLLYGVGGSGKSTILMNYVCNENTVNFYFPLYQYRREIHEKIRSGNCWILLQILLKYHYQYEYQTYETCSVCEGEDIILRQMAIIDRKLKSDPNNWNPEYVLLLDGFNEVSLKFQKDIISELTWMNKEWKNVRIIISGRTVPQYELFNEFTQIELCGIYESELRTALSGLENYDDVINDEKLMEVLKIPVFLHIYLENSVNGNKLNKCGEVIDSYIMNCKSHLFESDTVRFIVQFVLPLVCKRMLESFSCYKITRQDILDAIDHAIKIYILDECTYQNMIAPRNIEKKNILVSRKRDNLVEMVINNIGFVKIYDSKSDIIQFVHKFYRDYFAARHILNAIEALDIGYKWRSDEENDKYLVQLEIRDRWFSGQNDFWDNYDALRMIGEISGDYKNADLEYCWYTKTLLDKFLDLNRGKQDSCAADNIIRTMWISRNQVILGVDFTNLVFRWFLPTYAKYSLNGEDACDFVGSRVFYIYIFDSEYNDHLYAVFGDMMLIVFNNCGNVVLWHMKERKIVKEYNILKAISGNLYNRYFDYIEISDDHKYVSILSDFSMIVFELKTGKFVRKSGLDEKNKEEYEELYERYDKVRNSFKKLTPDFLEEVVSQMDLFRGCDFHDVMFADKREKEMLHKMGALCDMEEDNFMDDDDGWGSDWGEMYWYDYG